MELNKNSSLEDFYDNLKGMLNNNPPEYGPKPTIRTPAMNDAYMMKATKIRDDLKERCARHIIIDIYSKVLPLDDDFKCHNHALICKDVDNMLASKKMTPTEYLKSCTESTGAPLLQFINKSIDRISDQYFEDAKERLKDENETDTPVTDPEVPEIDDMPPEENTDNTDDSSDIPDSTKESDNVNSSLVDIKDDDEYEDFVEKLKEKTIKKIVNDISKLITDKKDEKKMKFEPTPEAPVAESAVAISMDYIQERLLRNNMDLDENKKDEMMGMAIRESTLNEINKCFNQPGTSNQEISSSLRFNRGAVITESSIDYLAKRNHD